MIADNVPMIFGDEGTLVEAIVNIVGNAIKYSPSGSHVDITATYIDQKIVIRIQDNGLGISKEDLPFIFEDFYCRSDVNKPTSGSGVGLALTRRIVEAHDGTITVASELGQGSTFEMSLPGYDNETKSENSKLFEPVNNI